MFVNIYKIRFKCLIEFLVIVGFADTHVDGKKCKKSQRDFIKPMFEEVGMSWRLAEPENGCYYWAELAIW